MADDQPRVPAPRRRRGPGPALALGLTLGGVHALPALAGVAPGLRPVLGVADHLQSADEVALTFDDGPHRQGTPATLELLDGAGVRACFFLVGEQVRAQPALAAEIVAAGHQVGVHCDRHRNLLRVGPRGTHEDLARAAAAIEDACAVHPTLHRPPYGVLNAWVLAAARARGWRTWLWTRWGRDWEARARPEAIAERASAGLRGGDVVLLHDADHYSAPESWRRTVGALPTVLDAAPALGLRWGPLG